MYEQILTNIQGKSRKEKLEGRTHIVVEGALLGNDVVLEGSEGPILYPGDENEKSVASWNHMPIVVHHPKKNGKFVSARQPAHLNAQKVGIVLNTKVDDKLRTEYWFDEERTKEVDQRILDAIAKGTPLETSTGLGAEKEVKSGESNGVKYKSIARNYKPDHVAILPDKVGAYSVKMGGGLFANEEKPKEEKEEVEGDEMIPESHLPESTVYVLRRSVDNIIANLGGLVGNEMSYSQMSSQLSTLLSSQYGEKGKYWNGYICDMYPDYVVFTDGAGVLYKAEYTASDSGITLKGTAVKVVRTTEYKPIANEAVTVANQSQETTMFDKKAHVTSLIANGQIEEAQRAAFEASDENVLKAMKVIPKAPVVTNEPAPVPTPAATVVANQAAADFQSWLKSAPKEFVDVYNQGQKALAQTRDTYVKKIKANPGNKFTDKALADMDLDMLAGVAEIAGSTVVANEGDDRFLGGWQPNYGGAAGYAPPIANAQADLEELPDAAEMTFDSPFGK